uniref:Uncharacterized protein n=1 Tax=Sphaeramia orbicularis TaxID=375764 RepID=A0A672ZYM1_9TELE
MGETEDERTAQASQLFENFVQASTCKGTLQAFSTLCRQLDLDPLDYSNFYSCLKATVCHWKVKALWTKLDKRAQQKVYNQNKACQGTRCLIIGGGPCGLRTAIELALLGCKVVVIEKRDTFSRNNVLHLWPFTIHDLRGLGAKKFYGKFCAGSIDHISIRQLQLMLLKVSLILGIEIHVNVEFVKVVEPPEEQTDDSPGWRAEVRPSTHIVSDFDFDVVIGADGRKNTLDGFARKEFRGKLAIAITANFVNRNTTAEAKVEEISGVAFIFNQKFFLELKEDTGLHRNRASAERRQRQPGGLAVLCPRGCRLWNQLPAAVSGLRHQPLRTAGCGHVRLHQHVRIGERRPDQGETRTSAAGGAGWR